MRKRLIFVGALLVVQSVVHAQQEPSVGEIQEVTIAGKQSQQLYATGKNVTLLTPQDLQRFKGSDLSEVLQSVSGIQLTGASNNPQEPKFPKVRGGKLANVLILIDGVPLKDVTGNDYTATDLRLIPLESIESIEILNGSSSVLYGSNATVSVINIRTLKSAQRNLQGIAGLKGGSFGHFGQQLALRGKLGAWSYDLSGTNEKQDGLSSAKGENFDKDGSERQSLGARIGYDTDSFGLYAQGNISHHFHEDDQGAFSDGKGRGDDSQNFIGLGGYFNYKGGQLVLNSRLSGSERTIQNLNSDQYRDEYFYEGENNFVELLNHYTFNEHISLSAGVSYETQRMGSKALPWGGESMEEVLVLKDTKVSNFDVFANANLNWGVLHLDLGARNTHHSEFGNHLVYSINPFVLKEWGSNYYKIGYSYATAFIAPTLYQFYGSLPYTIGNKELVPETNSTHEINFSVGRKDQSLVLNGALFQRNEEDVFAYVNNPDFTGQFINVNENKVKGFEVGFDSKVVQKWRLGANFSFVEKDNELTRLRQPKQRINSYLQYDPFASTSIALSHQFVSSRTDSYWDEQSASVKDVNLESYHVFRLSANQKITDALRANLNIGNLFNKSYTDVAGYTTLPRNYMIGVEYQF